MNPSSQVTGYKKKSAFREWVEAVIFAAFLAFCVIRPFIVEAFKIPSGSMRPTLLEGDRILVSKFMYGARVPFTKLRLPGFKKPRRGDVIVFIGPEDRRRALIKRLIACAGETVQIINGTIYIDGQPLTDGVFSQRYYYNRGPYGEEGLKVLVPQGQYFVLGDNSASSRDSRYWGFLPKENLLGKAFIIWWPLNRIRIIK
jgi:signal peptidase I